MFAFFSFPLLPKDFLNGCVAHEIAQSTASLVSLERDYRFRIVQNIRVDKNLEAVQPCLRIIQTSCHFKAVFHVTEFCTITKPNFFVCKLPCKNDN